MGALSIKRITFSIPLTLDTLILELLVLVILTFVFKLKNSLIAKIIILPFVWDISKLAILLKLEVGL